MKKIIIFALFFAQLYGMESSPEKEQKTCLTGPLKPVKPAEEIYDFLCEHLNDANTPVPDELVNSLISNIKGGLIDLESLQKIPASTIAKPWKRYKKFYSQNINPIRLKYDNYYDDLYALIEHLHEEDKILPLGVIFYSSSSSIKKRIDFIDTVTIDYPGIMHDKAMLSKEEEEEKQCSTRVVFGNQTTGNLLRLLLQCDRVEQLNSILKEVVNVKYTSEKSSNWLQKVKNVFSKNVTLDKGFKKEVEKYSKKVAKKGNDQDVKNSGNLEIYMKLLSAK